MNAFLDTFGKTHGILIGVIHFPPLLGVEDAPSTEVALQNALADLQAFEQGGVDAIIIENNYDLPHDIHAQPGTIAAMTRLGISVRAHTKLPIGVCVLWNDYESSFAVAKTIGAQFIRIPVFVDTVKTDFGLVTGTPDHVHMTRKKMHAEDIGMLVDIHVKHAEVLSGTTLVEAANLAIQQKADCIIVTGAWTGDPPSDSDLFTVRDAIGTFPLFAGSGVDEKNVSAVLRYANGAIVSTSLKEGGSESGERNVKSWKRRILLEKVRNLANATRYPDSRV